MGIEVITQLQKEVDTLKKELETTKTEAEKRVGEFKKEFEEKLTERKTAFAAKEVPVSDREVEKAKKEAANLHLKALLLGRPVSEMKDFQKVAGVVEKAIKPNDITDWLAEEFSNQIMGELELDLKVEGLFSKVKMPDNRNTFSIPARTEDAKAYLIAAGDDAISSTINGAKVTFETHRFKTLIGVTDQADQEMITAILDIVRRELVRSIARASEDAIIMGDVDNSDDNDVKKAFNGLLKYAKDAGNKVDAGGDDVTATIVAQARRLLLKYGLRVSSLAIIAPVNVAFQLIELPEVITVDKYGASATILTGEIGKLYGIPVVVSEYIPSNLDENGDVDEDNGDKTAVLIVNREYFAVADRSKVGIERDRNIVSSTNLYVAYRDIDFKKLAVNATPVSTIVNVKSS